MWSKPQESAIESAVDRPVDHPPMRDGLRSRAGHGAVPEFIKILEAVLATARSPLSTMALASATAVLKLERFIVDGRAASAANPQGHWLLRRAAADRLRSSVNKAIDLRIDIVILLADATRTGGWSASPDVGCTRIARLRGAARQAAL
jgi:hypothetical protein